MQLRILIALSVFLIPAQGGAEKPKFPPARLILTLAQVMDSKEPHEFVFVLNGTSVFRTIPGLKAHLARYPEGSTLTWAPGCMRMGNEPLLDSEKEMKEFSEYLDSIGIEFTLVPSG